MQRYALLEAKDAHRTRILHHRHPFSFQQGEWAGDEGNAGAPSTPPLPLPIAHCGAMPGAARCIGLRSVLHEPSQRTALSVPASPAYPRSGTSLPEEPTSLPRQPHYESQEAAPALPAQNASRGETASCVPFPLAPDAAGQSRSAWQEISSPCAP